MGLGVGDGVVVAVADGCGVGELVGDGALPEELEGVVAGSGRTIA